MNKIRKYVKEHKTQFIIGGGAILLVGGYFVGKKIGKGESSMFSRQIGDVARDIKVTQPVPLPEGVSEIWKQIDEDVFLDVADEIENALIDLNRDTFDYARSWDVADGVVKTLKVTMETTRN